MNLYKSLGHYIKTKRVEKGWFQSEAAEKAHISIDKYKKYEDNVIPCPTDFKKIYKLYNLDEVICRILLKKALLKAEGENYENSQSVMLCLEDRRR